MIDLPGLSLARVLTLPRAAKIEALQLLEEAKRRKAENQLATYWPYPKQQDFHAAGATHRERLFMAGNRLGKTYSGAAEVAFHLTGLYPSWWKGKRFTRGNHWIAGSESGEVTRRGVQRLLLGRDIKTDWGTGAIPKRLIRRIVPAMGAPDLASTIVVEHVSGEMSTVSLKSYEQGRGKWQADDVDGVWFDEEPPSDVYFEGLTRTNTTLGPVIVTFTPLKGMSDVVLRYLQEKPAGSIVVRMGIYDADHYTREQADAIVATYPPHERRARAYGEPVLGSGAVYPVDSDTLSVPAFAIPAHWPRICGLDFGWDHPTCAVWLAWDRDTDTVYVTDAYRVSEQTPVVHAAAIKARGAWIPVAWPGDGLQTEKGSGFQLHEQYSAQGVAMLPERAQFEATNANDETPNSRVSVEAGIAMLLARMQAGQFKVFSHLNDWFDEYRMYHRKDGKIVKVRDDLMDATRYAAMMLRYAICEPRPVKKRPVPMSWRV